MLASGCPEEPQTWQRYAYVGGQATTVTDESGLIWLRNKLTGQIGWYAGHRAPRGYDELEVGTILAVEHGRGRFKTLEGHLVKLGANGKPIDLGLLPRDDTAIDFQHGLGTDFAIAYAQHVGGALVGAFAAVGVVSLGAKLLPAISSASKAGSGAARFIVSPTGATVEKAIADKWARGTFANVVDSIEYHFARHGAGRTLQQYTDDALRFFQQNKAQAQWGKWNPKWGASYRLKVGNRGGYYTADGRVITYWDK